jgi:hypothetical protein
MQIDPQKLLKTKDEKFEWLGPAGILMTHELT